ncbi:hypothetical protein RJ640_005822 [Escallonia rubra]|uniref:Uncharacterized protein n=1 Tax=Escallonia rubra TaxID=112253 RepID=A0AA88QVV8_9ASTE|nr:hypothetical protein RJ640_005822 [Escallonia rubra]
MFAALPKHSHEGDTFRKRDNHEGLPLESGNGCELGLEAAMAAIRVKDVVAETYAPLAVAAASVPVNFPGTTFSNGIKAAFYAVFLAQLSDTVLGALLASHETVAIAMSFVLYYLADHPDVYAKVLKGTKLFCAFLQRFYCRLLEKSGRDRGVGIAGLDMVD